MTKEEEIIMAAEDEFFSNGYDACSTATIAKRAGVTHAMVNYYFRSKEKLFLQILDRHVQDLLLALRPLMQADGNVGTVVVAASSVIFDKINEDRRFPFLLSDISRTHPEFLLKYRETVSTVFVERMRSHAARLDECILSTVLTLASAPFMTIPALQNVAGMSEEEIDSWLAGRKEEMKRILNARYFGKD